MNVAMVIAIAQETNTFFRSVSGTITRYSSSDPAPIPMA
jgi:hypothetical protein